MHSPAFDKIWEAVVNASFALLEDGLRRHDGLDQALSLINESLTDAGALLASPHFAASSPARGGTDYWRDAYATKLVAVYACSVAATLISGPPRMSDDEAIEFCFGSTLGLAQEVLARRYDQSALDWYLLLTKQMAKAFRQVRVLDLAVAGDEWARDQITALENEASPGEWARAIPVTLLAIGAAALAAITDLCPEGFRYVEDFAFRVPLVVNAPEELD
jgi:hypothetical protein